MHIWPANVLQERITRIFEDGVVDQQEQMDLERLLTRLTGVSSTVSDAEFLATRLPVDDPLPDVRFPGSSFCLTGKFVLGSREKCERLIVELGGEYHPQPGPGTNFLVIGALGSPFWAHSTHGRKVEAVMEHRGNGAATCIVPEEHWTFFLDPRLGGRG